MSNTRELPIPPEALEAPRAVEVVRAWVASNDLHVSLTTGIWKDPAAWGVVLVDLAKHIARAYEQTDGPDEATSLALIRKTFDAEWENPSGEVSGSV